MVLPALKRLVHAADERSLRAVATVGYARFAVEKGSVIGRNHYPMHFAAFQQIVEPLVAFSVHQGIDFVEPFVPFLLQRRLAREV
jgi:hypothetical protein